MLLLIVKIRENWLNAMVISNVHDKVNREPFGELFDKEFDKFDLFELAREHLERLLGTDDVDGQVAEDMLEVGGELLSLPVAELRVHVLVVPRDDSVLLLDEGPVGLLRVTLHYVFHRLNPAA